MSLNSDKNKSGISSGVGWVTSTVDNRVSDVVNTAGNVVGTAGRGLTGETAKPVGGGLKYITNGIEGGAASVADGAKKAGGGK
ncbi:hypothetical protein LCER1_G004767 [Lachnellula cervina]|uniref:Uncharacterized protein n=1 Tax=Lachnellula cervina TaxID=1316786 RepID=A0A7D8UT09_9HELO|nr:hypothetical protein LCER1_G004767 [Lachnellula cervina]